MPWLLFRQRSPIIQVQRQPDVPKKDHRKAYIYFSILYQEWCALWRACWTNLIALQALIMLIGRSSHLTIRHVYLGKPTLNESDDYHSRLAVCCVHASNQSYLESIVNLCMCVEQFKNKLCWMKHYLDSFDYKVTLLRFSGWESQIEHSHCNWFVIQQRTCVWNLRLIEQSDVKLINRCSVSCTNDTVKLSYKLPGFTSC